MVASQTASALVENDPTAHPLERRGASRIHAVCFLVKVARRSDIGLFRVQNISDTGMMLVAHVDFDAGERVSISLGDEFAVEGTVVWSEGCCRGIAFDRPINCAAVLQGLAQDRKDRRGRCPRLPVTRLATLYSEAGIRAVKVVDVSRSGIGFECDKPLQSGITVRLILEGGHECCGAIRWSHDGRVGVQLSEPWNCAELESVSTL